MVSKKVIIATVDIGCPKDRIEWRGSCGYARIRQALTFNGIANVPIANEFECDRQDHVDRAQDQPEVVDQPPSWIRALEEHG